MKCALGTNQMSLGDQVTSPTYLQRNRYCTCKWGGGHAHTTYEHHTKSELSDHLGPSHVPAEEDVVLASGPDPKQDSGGHLPSGTDPHICLHTKSELSMTI